MTEFEYMYDIRFCCVFRIILLHCCCKSISWPLFYCQGLQHWFWAVIQQILWHLYLISPEPCRAARCRISIGVQSSQSEGPREKGMKQRWALGDRMSLCAAKGLWDMQVFKTQLKEALEVKGLFVIHECKYEGACTHKRFHLRQCRTCAHSHHECK